MCLKFDMDIKTWYSSLALYQALCSILKTMNAINANFYIKVKLKLRFKE